MKDNAERSKFWNDDTIIVYLFRYNGDSTTVPENLGDFVAWVSEMLESVPQEHRATAKISIMSWDELEIEVYYLKPATNEEKTKRQAERDAAVIEREVKDRAEYERLRARFESERDR